MDIQDFFPAAFPLSFFALFLAASVATGVLSPFPPPIFASEDLVCDICSSPITGQYYTVRDRSDSGSGQRTICKNCHETRPRCDMCRGVARELAALQGKNLCPGCLESVKNSPRCSSCGDYITGSYVRYKDPDTGRETDVCAKCNESKPKCDMCRGIMLEEFSLQGMRLCRACVDRVKSSPTCSICKNYIVGDYVKYEDKKTGLASLICKRCGDTLDKCYVCGVPSDNLSAVRGKRVCGQCLARAKKCHGCGDYILKVSFNYEIAEQSYCTECENDTPKCDVCGMPAGPSPVKLSDGRIFCPDCEGTSVKDVETVRSLYEAVSAYLVREYRMEIAPVSEIGFREIGELAELGKGAPTAEKDVVPLGLFYRRGPKVDIYVQKNLPRNLLTGVIAHEYAHAYMYEKSPDFRDSEISEGFAEWIRYKTLMRLNDEKGAKLIELRRDIYGRGYQKVSKVEKESGLQGVFDLFLKK